MRGQMCKGPGAEGAWLRASVSGLRGKWWAKEHRLYPGGREEEGKVKKTLLHRSSAWLSDRAARALPTAGCR